MMFGRTRSTRTRTTRASAGGGKVVDTEEVTVCGRGVAEVECAGIWREDEDEVEDVFQAS